MTKHTDNAVAITTGIHGGEFLSDGVDAPPTPTEPQRGGESMAQAPIKRRAVGEKRKAAGADDSRTAGQKPAARSQSKTEIVLKKLRSAKGATIESLMEATGWQAHSVRGFLSAVVKKKLGVTLVSEIGKDGTRRYRAEGSADSGNTDWAR